MVTVTGHHPCTIIEPGMGDDLPILGALVTFFDGNVLLLFLMMFLYISMVRSLYTIIVSGMGDDVPILGALVTLFDDLSRWFISSLHKDHIGQQNTVFGTQFLELHAL